jgi:hypothetical protein
VVCAIVQIQPDVHSPAICKSLEGRPSPEQPAALAWAATIASRHAFISLVRCRIVSWTRIHRIHHSARHHPRHGPYGTNSRSVRCQWLLGRGPGPAARRGRFELQTLTTSFPNERTARQEGPKRATERLHMLCIDSCSSSRREPKYLFGAADTLYDARW